MPAKKKRTKTAKKKRASGAAKKRGKTSAAEAHFVEGLLTRGEAVRKKSAGQKLPPGATHWLVEDAKTGRTTVKRERISLV